MIVNRKKFTIGAGLLLGFIIVLIIIFLPIFNGQNGLAYLDALYNSISKGSAYYIPKLRKESDEFSNRSVKVSLPIEKEQQRIEISALLTRGGAQVDLVGVTLNISGDLGSLLANCLEDADYMFKNERDKISHKYGYPERRGGYRPEGSPSGR